MTEVTQELAEEIADSAPVPEPEEEEIEETPVTVAEEDDEEPEKVPTWATKRFNKLTRQKYEALTEAEKAKKEADYWKSLAQGKDQPQPAKGKPDFNDFDSNEEYLEALADWKIETKNEQLTQKQREQQAELEKHNKALEFETKRNQTISLGKEKYNDFEHVVFSLPPEVMNESVAETLFNTDMPEDIAYHLGKNPEEAAKLAQLPPLKRAVEFGKIETRLKAQMKKKTTNAPPPIKPVNSKGEVENDWMNDPNISPKEWAERRNKQLYG